MFFVCVVTDTKCCHITTPTATVIDIEVITLSLTRCPRFLTFIPHFAFDARPLFGNTLLILTNIHGSHTSYAVFSTKQMIPLHTSTNHCAINVMWDTTTATRWRTFLSKIFLDANVYFGLSKVTASTFRQNN